MHVNAGTVLSLFLLSKLDFGKLLPCSDASALSMKGVKEAYTGENYTEE